jgi:hypothetical protein
MNMIGYSNLENARNDFYISSVDEAREDFFDWWKDGTAGKLGEGRYAEVAAKVTEAAKGLQTDQMTLHFHQFQTGFNFGYGEKPGVEKYIPIPRRDVVILVDQAKAHHQENVWPIKNPDTDEYFVPKVTLNWTEPCKGHRSTTRYFEDCLKEISMDYPVGHQQEQAVRYSRMFEALVPYDGEILMNCGGRIYQKIETFNPAYRKYQFGTLHDVF